MTNEKVVHCQLKAVKEARYTLYVFQELETGNYIMCTKLPNWQSVYIEIGDIGYLQYQRVIAGEEYYDPDCGLKKYKYSNLYFINFLKDSDIKNLNMIL